MGFTDRHGGVSVGDFAGLNLGGHVGDDPEAVRRNRSLVAADLGLADDRLVLMEQVHGARVARIEEIPATPPRADAMVTARPGLALAVLVADCVPVLLADEQAGVAGVAHAGRAGLIEGVVPAVVAALRDLGARALRAVVGPAVCGRCYEVPAGLRDAARDAAPESAARSWCGTPSIDVATGVVAQLADLGVQVDWRPGCTREDPSLYSHRRDGRTGRFAGVVVAGVAA